MDLHDDQRQEVNTCNSGQLLVTTLILKNPAPQVLDKCTSDHPLT